MFFNNKICDKILLLVPLGSRIVEELKEEKGIPATKI